MPFEVNITLGNKGSFLVFSEFSIMSYPSKYAFGKLIRINSDIKFLKLLIFIWEEKKIFLESNKNIQFINPKLKMTDLLKKSKLIIYSFPSTGHLECMSANIPMLLFYFNDLELLKKETKLYFKEFIKLGILHTDPDKLYKKLIEIYDNPSEWWYSKKIQKSVNNYAARFCKRNDNLIKDLSNIIMDK